MNWPLFIWALIKVAVGCLLIGFAIIGFTHYYVMHYTQDSLEWEKERQKSEVNEQ